MISLELISLLGLAQKAGRVFSGDNTCRAKLKYIKLVILSEDCSDKTKDFFQEHCKKEQKPILIIGRRVDLGLALGKSPRTVVGITDLNFARQIIRIAGNKAE
jgi:ribosomal protein L7Ae-like RNA K-turn-binding protein